MKPHLQFYKHLIKTLYYNFQTGNIALLFEVAITHTLSGQEWIRELELNYIIVVLWVSKVYGYCSLSVV